MAVAFSKVNAFVEEVAEKKIDLGGTLKAVLTNTAHTATWYKLSELTVVSTTNLTVTPIALTVASSAQTGGTYKLCIADITLTATGAVGPFQYIYLYDDASTDDLLIGYYDYGSAVTLANGDTFTIDFDATNGVLTLA